MKITHLLAVVAVAVLIAGCCPCTKQRQKAEKQLRQGEWTLTQFEGRAFQSNGNYTIKFSDENKINGTGDCNTLMGSFTSDEDGHMRIEKVASTMKFCPNQEMENKFTKMLEKVDAYRIDGDLLILFIDGEMMAVFEPKK